MRLPGFVALIVLALLTPGVGAGSEDDPEISAPQRRGNPAGDLLAVWYEHDARGLRITFKVATVSADVEATAYYTTFGLDGRTYAPGIGFDDNGRLHTDSGANPSGWGRGRLDERPIIDSVERGSPAYLSMIVPWGLYGLEEGSVVQPRMASTSLCCDPATGDWFAPYETANARGGTFVVAASSETSLFPILVPAWVIPTIVLVCVAGGMVVGLALARVKSKVRPAIPATAVDVRAAPPPGQRFQRAPPTSKR